MKYMILEVKGNRQLPLDCVFPNRKTAIEYAKSFAKSERDKPYYKHNNINALKVSPIVGNDKKSFVVKTCIA